MSTRTPEKSPWSQVAVMVGALTLIISAILTAFAWPATRASLHDIPLAVAGPAAAVEQVSAALEQKSPGAFDVVPLADTAAAEHAIGEREVYGAIDVSSGSPQVITATAAGPVVAQALQSLGQALAAAQNQTTGEAPAAASTTASTTAAIRDLAPLPADDPRGAGLAAGSLPLVLGGMLAAVLLSNRVRGAGRRLTGALAYSITGGLAMAAILQFWLGSLEGSYWANAGAIALSVAATSFVILGLESLLGTAGFAIGAVTMMLLGNPFSGTTSAPEMLPGWSGEFGQFLPPGAAGWLLRSTAFFDGHGATHSIIVLVVWLAAGAVLTAIGTARSSRRDQNAGTPAPSPVPALT
ncbi:hypothetical protein [Kineosporia succinea]|uniref:ABC transporter permease n=1 Tax=Kineosporia succinea TaxID=84632 RepID=A0ABT9PB21_9ACTN|nr:hypothetical protein [Kineosporia succinea]MDP9829863.1 hypothetical protein [Kineosporia succinea]